MSRKALSIVANEAVRHTLGQLGSPLVQVAVRGRVTNSRLGNVLTIENVSTSRSATLPIVASAATKKALGGLAEKHGTQSISLLGRVVSANGTNTLLLDRVDKTLAIVADAATREMFSDLASDEGETNVTAKVVEENGRNYLVLAGNGNGKNKSKKSAR